MYRGPRSPLYRASRLVQSVISFGSWTDWRRCYPVLPPTCGWRNGEAVRRLSQLWWSCVKIAVNFWRKARFVVLAGDLRPTPSVRELLRCAESRITARIVHIPVSQVYRKVLFWSWGGSMELLSRYFISLSARSPTIFLGALGLGRIPLNQ